MKSDLLPLRRCPSALSVIAVQRIAHRFWDPSRSADSENREFIIQPCKREAFRIITLHQVDAHQTCDRQALPLEVPGNACFNHKAFIKDRGNWGADIHVNRVALPDPFSLFPIDFLRVIKGVDDVIEFWF